MECKVFTSYALLLHLDRENASPAISWVVTELTVKEFISFAICLSRSYAETFDLWKCTRINRVINFTS